MSSTSIYVATLIAMSTVICALLIVLERSFFNKGKITIILLENLKHPVTYSEDNFDIFFENRALQEILKNQVKQVLKEEQGKYRDAIVKKNDICLEGQLGYFYANLLETLINNVSNVDLFRLARRDYINEYTRWIQEDIKKIKDPRKLEEVKNNCKEIVKKWRKEAKRLIFLS